MGTPITPLASLCLGVVRGWINVARKGRGGQIDEQGTPWTRLPADQLRDQLSREFLVEVSTRSIQRALKELEDTDQIRREQKWKHRYRRDYWYAIPAREEALEALRPRTISGNYQSQRSRPRNHIETTRASGHVLPTQKTKTQFFKTENKNQQPERKETHMDAVATCNAYGKTPPRPPLPQSGGLDPKSLEPETSGTNGSAEKRESTAGQGFINKTTGGRAPAWHAGGQKHQITREVEVGGMTYRVADDARTSPIR
jgi:hypothetical protein